MLDLFNQNRQLLDEDIIEWIFSTYAWAFEQFDKDVFVNETELVIPDNKHFPGRETTAEGMANLIFDQVKGYAGMAHWPTQLFSLEDESAQVPVAQTIKISGGLRGRNALINVTQVPTNPNTISSNSISADTISQSATDSRTIEHNPTLQSSMPQSCMPQLTAEQDAILHNQNTITPNNEQVNSITFTYHPQQLKSPEGVIAHFAHGLSHHLASASNTAPPGGLDYLPMAGELTGIFMGFGLMFANSAVIQRSGGCGHVHH